MVKVRLDCLTFLDTLCFYDFVRVLVILVLEIQRFLLVSTLFSSLQHFLCI